MRVGMGPLSGLGPPIMPILPPIRSPGPSNEDAGEAAGGGVADEGGSSEVGRAGGGASVGEAASGTGGAGDGVWVKAAAGAKSRRQNAGVRQPPE